MNQNYESHLSSLTLEDFVTCYKFYTCEILLAERPVEIKVSL